MRELKRKILRGMLMAVVPPPMPPGAPNRKEGQKLYRVLRVTYQMGHKQAYSLAVMVAWAQDCWKTERKIALFVGSCRKTVSLAVQKAKMWGVLVAKRIKCGEIPPGGVAPTKTGLSLRHFTAFGTRSLSRIEEIWAKYAWRDLHRRMRAQQNRQDAAAATGPP